MKKGDRAFFYHSSDGKEIVGIVEVVREHYPDPTAKAGEPWVVVDVKAREPLPKPVSLDAIKDEPKLKDMALLKISRLSVHRSPTPNGRSSARWAGLRPFAAADESGRLSGLPAPLRFCIIGQIKRRSGRSVIRSAAGRNAMSDKIYAVAPDWKKRAFIDDAKYHDMYAASIADPDKFWGEQAKRIDWIKPFTKVKEHFVRAGQRLDQMVRGRHAQRLLQLRRPPSREARQPDRDHLGRRRSEERQEDHLQGAACRGLPLRQCAEGAGASRRATASPSICR